MYVIETKLFHAVGGWIAGPRRRGAAGNLNFLHLKTSQLIMRFNILTFLSCSLHVFFDENDIFLLTLILQCFKVLFRIMSF